MGDGDVCFSPVSQEPLMSVPPPNMSVPDEQVCKAPPPPKKAPPPPPKDEAKMSPKGGAAPMVSWVPDEPNMCVAPPPPPKVDDTKPKLEKLEKKGKIYEGTINSWAEDHKVAKKSDGWAMHAMDWVFASKANARYESQEKELKGLYGNFKAKVAAGDLVGAEAAYNTLMDRIKSFGGEAHRLNNAAIDKAEKAKKGAEVVAAGSAVVFVAAGTVVAAPVVAGAGAWAGGGALGFGAQVATGGVVVGGMEASRQALTKGGVALAGNAMFGDKQSVTGAMWDGAKTGFKDGFIGGAGGVVAGKVLGATGNYIAGKGASLYMSGSQGTGMRLMTAGVKMIHAEHWMHEGAHHLLHHGGKWMGISGIVPFAEQFAPVAVEQAVKYGVVKPVGGLAWKGGKLVVEAVAGKDPHKEEPKAAKK